VEEREKTDTDTDLSENKIENKPKKSRTPRSIPGISKEDFDNTKPKETKKKINLLVKSIANLVINNCAEEQDEIIEYVKSLIPIFQAVYNIMLTGTEFERCHDIMKIIADSYDNMLSIPKTGRILNIVNNYKISLKVITERTGSKSSVDGVSKAIQWIWRLLLLFAAATDSITETQMYRFIKDASDYIDISEIICSNRDDDWKDDTLKKGKIILDKMVSNKNAWFGLQSYKKQYRMRRENKTIREHFIPYTDYDDSDDDGCIIF